MRRTIAGLVVLILLIGAACGGSDSALTPTATPTPTSTPTPTATPTPALTTEPVLEPTAISATLEPLPSVARDDLPAMVLTQADIDAEFPVLQQETYRPLLDSEESGYKGSEAIAENTIDPLDTPGDVEAQGFLYSYQNDFLNLTALFGGEVSVDSPVEITSAILLFDTPESAQTYLMRQLEDYRNAVGQDLEGLLVEDFQEFTAPDVGTEAWAGHVDISAPELGLDISGTFIQWSKGPLAALVLLASHGDKDWSGATESLALLMDERIDGVLSGEITAAPIAPTSTPTPEPLAAKEAAQAQGFDLPAMLPTLADLTSEATIEIEGFVLVAGAISSYVRAFGSSALTMKLGSSQLIALESTVTLFASSVEAQGPVLVMQGTEPGHFEQFIGLGAGGLVEGLGLSPEALSLEAVDLPSVGDEISGFLMNIDAGFAGFDVYMLVFANGRVAVELLAVGPGGQVVLEDVVSLAELIDRRIQVNSPP